MTATASKTTVEKGDNAAYQQKLMGLLGNQDPIQVLSKTPDVVAGFVDN